jgi:glycosyltransferase involved in cell wall biosynthesis
VRILYLAPDAIPAPKGAAVRIERTLAAFRFLGHEVEALTPRAAPSENFLDRMLAFREEAAAWLAERQAALVQFRSVWEGAAALDWARRTGARAVFEVHGLPSVELPYHFPALEDHEGVLEKIILEERALLSAADRVLVPSRTSARFLMRLGVARSRVSVVPNAVDAAEFSPGAAPPPDAVPLRLVYVGTLSPWQGLGTLLEALALLRGSAAFELHVVGPAKSPWRAALRRQARRLRVHHLLQLSGPMAQADLVPVLRTAHVCLAPLPADARNALQGCCPLKVLEYMACGRPILSTRIAPVREVLDHGRTAHLVTAGSAAALADGLLWMLQHPAEREALGHAARAEAVSRWGSDGFAARLAEALARATA